MLLKVPKNPNVCADDLAFLFVSAKYHHGNRDKILLHHDAPLFSLSSALIFNDKTEIEI